MHMSAKLTKCGLMMGNFMCQLKGCFGMRFMYLNLLTLSWLFSIMCVGIIQTVEGQNRTKTLAASSTRNYSADGIQKSSASESLLGLQPANLHCRFEHFSPHNYLSQFLTSNLSTYMHILLVCFSGELWLMQRFIPSGSIRPCYQTLLPPTPLWASHAAQTTSNLFTLIRITHSQLEAYLLP